jgi:hypothetical protein
MGISTIWQEWLSLAMLFVKEHLSAGNNYNWTDEFIFDGTPSRRLFDRQNGNQLTFYH